MAERWTKREHRREALRLLRIPDGVPRDGVIERRLLEAQVHATLALSAPETRRVKDG